MRTQEPSHILLPSPEVRVEARMLALGKDHVESLLWSVGGETGLRLAIGMGSTELVSVIEKSPGLSQICQLADGSIGGHLFAQLRDPSHAYIQNVWVSPGIRRSHAALSMVVAAVAAARASAPDCTISAVVLAGNVEAEGLFRKAGFRATQQPSSTLFHFP
ncbi:MAG: GNAT family N-acetyltransferase [Deltaproteobacteria bacterium]|nr:GNAT family N-acetyltransferase [Deltaproteobacteria bacterium]